MANWYVSSVGWTAVTAWSAGSARALNSYTRQTAPAVGSERVFKATSVSGTGTTGGVEPTWVLTNGATTTDNAGANQIVWTEVTGKESEQASNAWNAPGARLSNITTRTGGLNSSDTIFLGQDHDETTSAALTIDPSSIITDLRIITVQRGVGSSVPPVTADLTTGSKIETSGPNSITLGGSFQQRWYFYGVTISAGSVANAASILFSSGTAITAYFEFENSSLVLNNTSGSSVVNLGSAGAPIVRLVNTPITFGASGQSLQIGGANLEWINTASAVAGTAPTTLFSAPAALASGLIWLRGLDLSAVTGNLFPSGISNNVHIVVANCKLAAGVAISSAAISPYGIGQSGAVAGNLRVDNCDDTTGGKNYRFAWYNAGGNVIQATDIIRTGGASDGVTSISWKATTGTVANNSLTLAIPQPLPAIVKRYNSITSPASSVAATVYFMSNATTALTNAQIWLEVEALTTSGVPLSTFTNNRVGNLLPSTTTAAQTTDTSAWDSLATARQNNHAYSIGDVFQVTGTNPGRVFMVTTAGTSAVSEPAAYGTAVDGTSITTDRNGGSMVVVAMTRQKLAVSFTPRVKGIVRATVKLAVASQTIYIDPMLSIA